MSIDAEQKMAEMMASKKKYLKKYKQARQLFNDLVDSQTRLLLNDSPAEGGGASGKIDVKHNIHSINEIMKMLFGTDRLILSSMKNFFSTEDYFFQHSVGVCYVGTLVLKRFNQLFSQYINNMLTAKFKESLKHCQEGESMPFHYYPPEAVRAISIGYLIHDMGKVMIHPSLLNKQRGLSKKEHEEMEEHVGEYGRSFLAMNEIYDVYVENIIKYHHASIYLNETNSYPDYHSPADLPPYVKICKLADMYTAMTLKRSYGEAVNPTKVVNTIFKNYSGRDPILQLILYSFVKEIGTCPAGSILTLKTGQFVYVVDCQGPEVIVFTDPAGKTIETAGKVINLSDPGCKRKNLVIDGDLLPKTPIEIFDRLPGYLQEFHREKTDGKMAEDS